MAPIERAGLTPSGPTIDLDRVDTLDQLEAPEPARVGPPALQSAAGIRIGRLLGLDDSPPVPGALDPPPRTGDMSLSLMNGTEVRGALRKILTHFEFNRGLLDQSESLRSDSTESKSLRGRLERVQTLMDELDGMLRVEDDILTRLVTEPKA